MPAKGQYVAARLAIREDGCWEWLGRRGVDDYGKWGRDSAHRRMYKLEVGPIPDGWEIDHLCRRPWCVNPDHLDAVTPSENIRRAVDAKTHCIHGHPFDEANTRVSLKADGRRRTRNCRACTRAAQARYQARLKQTRGAA